MERKELIVVMLLAILVALLATVRLFHGPLTSSPPEREAHAVRRPDGRDAMGPGSAADLAKRLAPFPTDRYTPRDPDTRSMLEAAERVFLQALTEANDEPAFSSPWLEAAVTTYQNFRRQYPDEPAAEVALLRIGQCYTVMKRFPVAARVYDRFLELNSKSDLRPMALLWSGVTHLRAGDTEVAKARLDEVIAQYPATIFAEGARLRVAEYHAVLKRYAEAARAYDNFLETCPKSDLRPVALLGSGESHLSAGDKATAKVRLEELWQHDPTSPFGVVAKRLLGQLDAAPPK